MALQDLEEFFDPTFSLPIRGKVYIVQSPDAATGVRIQRLFTIATSQAYGATLSPEDIESLELDDAEELKTYRAVLGATYDEMSADGVPWEMVKHAGTTAMWWIAVSREAAENFWSAGVGEARRPEPQDHQAPAKATRKKAAASPVSPDSSSESTAPDPAAPAQTP